MPICDNCAFNKFNCAQKERVLARGGAECPYFTPPSSTPESTGPFTVSWPAPDGTKIVTTIYPDGRKIRHIERES